MQFHPLNEEKMGHRAHTLKCRYLAMRLREAHTTGDKRDPEVSLLVKCNSFLVVFNAILPDFLKIKPQQDRGVLRHLYFAAFFIYQENIVVKYRDRLKCLYVVW